MSKAADYIGIVAKRLSKVVIENADFSRILRTYDKNSTLFYLDPPYYDAEKYYQDEFKPEDHIRLKNILYNIKGKFVLSYNDCDYIKELYKGYNITEADRTHNLVGGVARNHVIKSC